MAQSRTLGLLALTLLGCHAGDETVGPESVPEGLPAGVTVSAPVARADVGAPGAGSLVFVGMTPGSIAGAASVLVRGERGDSALALVQDGGFDPLPIAGELGDLISLSVVDSGGKATERQATVKQRPVRVVRTSPRPGKTDVPLNVRIGVVFSAPVDSASAVAGVGLWQGGSQVGGETRLTPDGLRIAFVPLVVLSPGTDYELRVGAGVRDVRGAPIGGTLSVPFRTDGADAPGGDGTDAPLGTLAIVGHEYPWVNRLVNPVRLTVGQSIDLYATTGGLELFSSAPMRWTSSNPEVVRVTERQTSGFAIETGVSPGRATVEVVAEGLRARLLVQVFDSVQPVELAAAQVYVDRYNSVWRQRTTGGEAVQLMDASELPRDSTLCRGNITPSCYWFPHMFAVSPAGRVAVTRASDIGGVWIKDGAGATPRQVNSPAERGAAHDPAWSPNGDLVAYWFDFYPEGVTELRIVNSDGTGQRVLSRVPYDTNSAPPGTDGMWASRPPGGPSFIWHPDGQRLLIWAPEGTIQTRIDGSGTSPYLAGYHPGPWFPGGEVQFVFRVRVKPYPEYEPFRVHRATAQGVVDLNTGFDAEYPPIDVSPDGLFMADWGGVFTMNRRASVVVTGYHEEHLIGFAR